MKKIGFIGLGIMGKPMAKNLIKANYDLIVYDINPEPVKELKDAGAKTASSSSEASLDAEIIITMLPNSPDVEAAVLGDKGVIEGIKSGTILIDMSTISPRVSKKIHGILKEKDVRMLDAPVSGGEKGAIEGTLAIMVGGEKEVFEQCLGLLNVMGKRVAYVGEIGMGGYLKLANQVMVGGIIEAVSEGLVLGMKAGLDPEIMLNVLGGGFAGTKWMEVRGNNIINGNFDPGFKIDLHFKDLGLALSAGKELGVPLPVTAYLCEVMNALRNKGRGDKDHSAVITFLEELANVQVRKKS